MTAALKDVERGAPPAQVAPGRVRGARRRRIDVLTAASYLVVVVALLWAVLPGVLAPYDPLVGTVRDALQPPSAQHWFGTDYMGRDLYSRVVAGARLSLQAAVLAVLIGSAIGSAVGLFAGYYGGRFSTILMRLVDVVLAVPSLLLSLVLIAAIGFGTVQIAVAVGFGSFAGFARLTRAEVVKAAASNYVEASRVVGGRDPWILRRHVLPNSVSAVVSLMALEFASAVLAVASLSFLGFGAAPPLPEWGVLVSEGRDYSLSAPWLLLFPGLTIAVIVIAVNRIGTSLRGAP